ncbi:PEP-CTERM sorting domain-containing protein [Microcystis aeruginosa CS-564/01]|uniref:PEP-CTERM sorting domain-containing protein n=1 Tax=Microcystis aeruginosa TaxID=1126 RepID=UPI00232E93A2|nr:PEP-CTERM sorting domain-containing protein [Microcystis aeruginosa]MDB9423879.1 PEP-CTERM sorting domain-containing protein [Microcystis aeruginosa CS-564/01]
MNSTTTFKSLSLSGVVFAGTVSAIAVLAALPVQALPIIYNPTPTVTMNTGSFSTNFGALVNTANGNGLTGTGNALQQQHVAGENSADFWSASLGGGATPADVNLDFNFGSPVFLDTLALWNYNVFDTIATDRGIKDFTLILSNNANFSSPVYVSGTLTLPEGTATNIPATIFSFPVIQAQYARIDVASNWGPGFQGLEANLIGLSEVRFAQTVPVPESSSGLGLLALGLLGAGAALKRHWN